MISGPSFLIRLGKTKPNFWLRVAGARLLGILPPYPPDLNPIEQAFAKIKHWMRTAQTQIVATPGGMSAASFNP